MSGRATRARAAVVALVIASALPSSALGQPTSRPVRPPSKARQQLTSPLFRPRSTPLSLHWDLLRLPERVFRLAVTPLQPLIALAERYRVDKHLYDLLTNDAETILFVPLINVQGSDGFGAGGLFTHSNLLGQDESLTISALVNLNADTTASVGYRDKLAIMSGRRFKLDFHFLRDTNVRFYGIDGDSVADDERGLRRDRVRGRMRLDLLGPGVHDFRSVLKVGVWVQRLSGGDRSGVPSLGSDDQVATPPGFGAWIPYFEGAVTFEHDSRDSQSLPTRGWLTVFELDFIHSLHEIGLSSMRATLDSALHIEILPRGRVLVLSAGVGGTIPWTGEDQIPYEGHIRLGRTNKLRGYARDRFVDRYGWWAGAEYRFPILEYETEGLHIGARGFVDLAQVGDDVGGLFEKTPRWSAGFGFHIATPLLLLFTFQVAFSPEGNEILFGAGDFL